MAYRLTEGNQEGAVGMLSEVGPIASMSPITAMPRSPRRSPPVDPATCIADLTQDTTARHLVLDI